MLGNCCEPLALLFAERAPSACLHAKRVHVFAEPGTPANGPYDARRRPRLVVVALRASSECAGPRPSAAGPAPGGPACSPRRRWRSSEGVLVLPAPPA